MAIFKVEKLHVQEKALSCMTVGSSEVPEIRIIVSVNPWTNAKT